MIEPPAGHNRCEQDTFVSARGFWQPEILVQLWSSYLSDACLTAVW